MTFDTNARSPADESDAAVAPSSSGKAGAFRGDLLLHLLLTLPVAAAWQISRLQLFKASDDTSYWIAVAGGSMMVLLFVFSTTAIQSPNLKGFLLSYNNSSIAWNVWQLEPSLQYYRDRNAQGGTNERWTPGLRVTYRGWERWSIESSLTYELGKASRVAVDPLDPAVLITTKESSSRANYALGARYSF